MRSELLKTIKGWMCIQSEALDNCLNVYANDVLAYMQSAGCTEEVLKSDKAIGCIARGVADLYYEQDLSSYFKERVTQLVYEKSSN